MLVEYLQNDISMEKNKYRVPVNVHKIIKRKIKKENLSLVEVAREINVSKMALYQLLDRRTMQIDRLWSLCVVLEINLFQEIANHLEIEHFSPAVEKKDKEIEDLNSELAELKEELKLLKRERDSFKEAISLMKG